MDKYRAGLRDKWKIEIVDDIPRLCSIVDGVLLESVDGRTHLNHAKPVFAAGKPVFIDKPLAASYRDAKEIARLAGEAGVPWFSSSSLRFWGETQRPRNSAGLGCILGYSVYGPSPIEPHHPDLMWYGIHAVEMLYTLAGTGCETDKAVLTSEPRPHSYQPLLVEIAKFFRTRVPPVSADETLSGDIRLHASCGDQQKRGGLKFPSAG